MAMEEIFAVLSSSRQDYRPYRWHRLHHKLDQQLAGVATQHVNCKDVAGGNQQVKSAAMKP
jgi:hypothetical protein